ncbi:hypothetical protein PVAND_004888 [Polypedilum vanderplanki]|uniref:Uncharacterized protein n=1 Tax=Polypedilum vanderplanki TaxID=319348 RepID=A0A9J6BZ36_POLVA|nr:hypothetical protein PVAND_004888 [Polypedilum vanderplanki]
MANKNRRQRKKAKEAAIAAGLIPPPPVTSIEKTAKERGRIRKEKQQHKKFAFMLQPSFKPVLSEWVANAISNDEALLIGLPFISKLVAKPSAYVILTPGRINNIAMKLNSIGLIDFLTHFREMRGRPFIIEPILQAIETEAQKISIVPESRNGEWIALSQEELEQNDGDGGGDDRIEEEVEK